jgi:hypothetical protein
LGGEKYSLTLGAFLDAAPPARAAAGAGAVFFPALGGYGHREKKTSVKVPDDMFLISKELKDNECAPGASLYDQTLEPCCGLSAIELFPATSFGRESKQ